MKSARLWITGGTYRRDHLRTLAQRVEVADGEVLVVGFSKSNLLHTLAAASGARQATCGVRGFCSEMPSPAGFEPALPP